MQYNRFNDRYLDIKSRGEVSEYLQLLLKNGQIKDCENLKVEEGYLHAFYPKCIKQYASRISAHNVHTDPSAGGAPSSYYWPKCPKDCSYYSKSNDFNHSLNIEIEEINEDQVMVRKFDSTLNPLPIIISTLSSIGNSDIFLDIIHKIIISTLSSIGNSDIFLDIIHKSGILIDLTLNKKQDYSHKTKTREYLKRLNDALQKTSENNLLHSLHLLVKNILDKFPEKKSIIEKELLEIGWEIKDTNLFPKNKDVIERFFEPGLVHSAYKSIRDIIGQAQSNIDIIDLYIDESLFEILKIKSGSKNISVRVLTKVKNDDFDHEKILFSNQYNNISVERKNIIDFHDRFIIIDKKLVYHLGASIKDAGRKAFMISKIEDDEIKNSIIKSFEDRWV
jgi:hypothetical protein